MDVVLWVCYFASMVVITSNQVLSSSIRCLLKYMLSATTVSADHIPLSPLNTHNAVKVPNHTVHMWLQRKKPQHVQATHTQSTHVRTCGMVNFFSCMQPGPPKPCHILCRLRLGIES